MNKETIEQIKKIPGVKTVTSVSGQLPNSENTVIVVFEPTENYKTLIKKAFEEGRLIEFTHKSSDEWRLCTDDWFNWEEYAYRIADPSDHWLKSVANLDASLANRIIKWFNEGVTYTEY